MGLGAVIFAGAFEWVVTSGLGAIGAALGKVSPRVQFGGLTKGAVEAIENPANAAVSALGSSTAPPTATPALLTRMSSLPNSAMTRSTRGRAEPRSAWSLLTAMARTPFALSFSTTAWALSAEAA